MDAHVVTEFNRRLNEGFRSGVSNGWCRDVELFKEILKTFPQAPVQFTIRNFTLQRVLRVVQVDVPLMGDTGRTYFNYADILVFFPELRFWEPLRANDCIMAETFITQGSAIARILRRELKLRHQFGPGLEKSSIKEHGPFK